MSKIMFLGITLRSVIGGIGALFDNIHHISRGNSWLGEWPLYNKCGFRVDLQPLVGKYGGMEGISFVGLSLSSISFETTLLPEVVHDILKKCWRLDEGGGR
jgi:hypothetical protein